MKHKITSILLSATIASAMLMNSPVATLKAAAAKPQYISDVFIAYGDTEEDARQWLIDNGWEPVKGDFNSGKKDKTSGFANVAAVMGIKRTSDPKNAITDMAVMNMNGGYSFNDYKQLLAEKKGEIDEFIYSFIPVLREYRANYNGNGSNGGQKRAKYAHDILNKFFDGEVDGKYAIHDTGKLLGDGLLEKTSTEYGQDAYNKLSKEEQLKYIDLQQIILESTGPAIETLEMTLALASDAGEESWTTRLEGLSGESLLENLYLYVPELEGQDVSDDAAINALNSHYADAAQKLALQWEDIHDDMIWYQDYCDENGLWPEDDESEEEFADRVNTYFEELKTYDEKMYSEDLVLYSSIGMYYDAIYEIPYEGDWGETLGDFFNPYDEEDYSNPEYFLPIAAALSAGQRAALDFLPLPLLLKLGIGGEGAAEAQFASLNEYFGDFQSISIYSGMNRAIFRDGVALTSEALQKQAEGRDPYGELWDEDGMVSIIAYSGFGVGAATFAVGASMAASVAIKVSAANKALKAAQAVSNAAEQTSKSLLQEYYSALANTANNFDAPAVKAAYKAYCKFGTENLKASKALDSAEKAQKAATSSSAKMATASRWIMGVGGTLMLMCAVLKGVQMGKYYNRDFTVIPLYIVDEADIVTYLYDDEGKPVLDEKGQQKREINFNQFAYYEVVKCNRQEIGLSRSAQDGVDQYEEWGCGDAADLNADVGKQWLALYTVKNSAESNPILANSLTYQTGSNKMPTNCDSQLHFFCYTHAANIADKAYAFDDKLGGIYLFWKTDNKAFTASTFSSGYIALSAVGGLVAGILGTTAFLSPKKKKKDEPNTPAVTA